MELNIGKSVRALRQERNVTQEELANAIGVTAQAVSKWERGEGYPDITLMPRIARYFEVSLDTVYGIDKTEEKQEIRGLINRTRGNMGAGERETLLREGLEKYPGSFELMAELADALVSGRKNPEEALSLYEEVLARCTDQAVRSSAYAGICRVLEEMGRHKEAVRAAEKLPEMTQTSAYMLSRILTGEKLIRHLQHSVQMALSLTEKWIVQMAKEDAFSIEERIRLREKALALYGILTDDGAHPTCLLRCFGILEDLARDKTALGDGAGCIGALSRAADCLNRHMAVPDNEVRMGGSLLQSRVKYSMQTRNLSKAMIAERWLADPAFEPVRDTEEFRAVLAKLTEA